MKSAYENEFQLYAFLSLLDRFNLDDSDDDNDNDSDDDNDGGDDHFPHLHISLCI